MAQLLPKSAKLVLRLPQLLWSSLRVWRKLGFAAARATLVGNVAFWSADPDRMVHARRMLRVQPCSYPHPISIRTYTSDVFVFEQIIVEEAYAPLKRVSDPRLIIDCGANIGCSSVYLLARYPTARLVAVEPDADNVRMCQLNLAPFGVQATVLKAGVWHRDAQLRVERGGFRDGREWSFQVRECRPGEECEIEAVSILSLLKSTECEHIDILKIDIEGAERLLFSEDCHQWLSRVGALAIEAHDDECRAAVMRAVNQHPFDVMRDKETIFCFRRPTPGDCT